MKNKWRTFNGTMYPVHSSQIKAIGWMKDTETGEGVLQVQFSKGILYQYWDVPKDLYQTFFPALSKGEWFDVNIKKNPLLKFMKEGSPTLEL